MFKWLTNLFYSVRFYVSVSWSKVKSSKRFGINIKRRASARQLFEKKQQDRYLFHSMLKEGDQYKVGEATVTLAKFGVEGKEEVKKKIAAADARRAEKQRLLTLRGEEIMLMSPDELSKFQLEEWLKERKDFQKKLDEFDSLPEVAPPNTNGSN